MVKWPHRNKYFHRVLEFHGSFMMRINEKKQMKKKTKKKKKPSRK